MFREDAKQRLAAAGKNQAAESEVLFEMPRVLETDAKPVPECSPVEIMRKFSQDPIDQHKLISIYDGRHYTPDSHHTRPREHIP